MCTKRAAEELSLGRANVTFTDARVRDILRLVGALEDERRFVKLSGRLTTSDDRRVVGALSLLIASKLLNVGTPFLFKPAVDALAVSTAGAAPGPRTPASALAKEQGCPARPRGSQKQAQDGRLPPQAKCRTSSDRTGGRPGHRTGCR